MIGSTIATQFLLDICIHLHFRLLSSARELGTPAKNHLDGYTTNKGRKTVVLVRAQLVDFLKAVSN